jgi:signal transduction histidine kinase/CheY-like chemotaxis protein
VLGWPTIAVVVVALMGASGAFWASRAVVRDDEHRLLELQATEAASSLGALGSQLRSTLIAAGAVAASTGGDPVAVERFLTPIVGSQNLVSVSVLRGDPGRYGVVASSGEAPTLPGDPEHAAGLRRAFEGGGFVILGFEGRGPDRRLGVAVGPPDVAAGFVVHADLRVPEGTITPSPFEKLDVALYVGTEPRPDRLVFATRRPPLPGRTVARRIDLGSASASTAPSAANALVVVGLRGPVAGALAARLPEILFTAIAVTGLAVGGVVETTRRRRDEALRRAAELAERNAELDRAVAAERAVREEQARLEARLRQAERLEVVGQLAGGIAHDFNNLLAVIQSYSSFVLDSLGDDHAARADVEEIRKAAARAAELTRQLLVFSRRGEAAPAAVDVNEAIHDLLRILERAIGEHVRVETHLREGLPHVFADRHELEQVVMNLALNARDAMPAGGTLVLETSAADLDEHYTSQRPGMTPGRYVVLAVSDSGAGMSEEVASRAFEPFFSTKPPGQGTGLGLSTVYGIVTRRGGHVAIYSAPGVGTTVRVYLPATEAEAQPVHPPTLERSGGRGETVLVVEDEEAVRRAVRRVLERAGYAVLEAAEGPGAVEAYRDVPVDLLLTDVVMPGGISGPELAEAFRSSHPGVRVLFMSGYSSEAVRARALADGVVVEKPFTEAVLLQKVREALDSDRD